MHCQYYLILRRQFLSLGNICFTITKVDVLLNKRVGCNVSSSKKKQTSQLHYTNFMECGVQDTFHILFQDNLSYSFRFKGDMAGIVGFENFVDELKQLYVSKRHSDVQIKVNEVDEVTHVIEAHAFVLEMNSTFFENLLKDHKKGEVEFEIKLKTGQGKFMEILVSGFYDGGFLNDFSMNDILCVLELAVIYANDEFLKNVTQLLEDVEIDYNICCSTSNTIYLLEHDNLNVELTTNVKARCTKFFANLSSPIEMKHEGFVELEYAPLLYLLQSDEVISISENSLLTFIILWLEYDITRQKGSIIESLLKSFHVKFLSIDYLFSTITNNHFILSKWDGFNDWIYFCLGVLGMSACHRESKYPNVDKQVSRNVAHGIHSWYQNYIKKHLCAVRWLVRMTPEKS